MSYRDQYAYDAHLHALDAQLPSHSGEDFTPRHRQAAVDLRRDLQRHGYLQHDDHQLLDAFEEAVATLEFTATADGALTVPRGTVVRHTEDEDLEHGARSFATDAELVVPAGESATVIATATAPGATHNVEAQALTVVEGQALTNLESVANPDRAVGGADHALTRAASWLALAQIYEDWARMPDDANAFRADRYYRRYREELKRTMAAGLPFDLDGDGTVEAGEKAHAHGIRYLHRS